MIVALLGCGLVAPGGAESPSALQVGIENALADGERWRVIDYVQPEDRDVFLAELELSAGFAKIGGGPEAAADLDAIDAAYGVPKHAWPRQDPVAYTAAIERVYAGVTDPRGLARALVAFQQRYAPGSVSPPGPQLDATGTALVFGTKVCPIVEIDGRYYIDVPDPAARVGRPRPAVVAVSDPYAGWDRTALAERFDGGTWLVRGDWAGAGEVWTFARATVEVIAGREVRTLAYSVASPCALVVRDPDPQHPNETTTYFGWDGPVLHVDAGDMGYRDHGAIVACGDRGTVLFEDGSCTLWRRDGGGAWRSTPARCEVSGGEFHAEGDFGSMDLAFVGDALVNSAYDTARPPERFADAASAQLALLR